MRGDIDRLIDITDAIKAILRYTAAGRESFDTNELVRVWCLRHIEVIGEAGLSAKVPLHRRRRPSAAVAKVGVQALIRSVPMPRRRMRLVHGWRLCCFFRP